MKKLLYLFLIFGFNLALANSLENLNQLYAEKEYKTVHKQVQAYLKKNPLSLEANLLLANSAYKLGNLDEAMAAYDRVLILEPNHIYAKIQEAKIYAKSGYKDISLLETDALLAQDLTPKQKEEVLKLKASLGTTQKSDQDKQTLLKGLLSIGLLYDTNTDSSIGEKSFKIPGYNLNYQGQKQEKDFAHFEQLYLTADTAIHNQIGLFATLNAYNRSYFDRSNNNLAYLFANISPYYQAHDFKIFLPLIFNKVFLEHDSYLNTYGTGLELKKSLKNALFEAGYRYYQNRYYGTNRDKNSHHHDVRAGVKYIVLDDVLTYLYLRYAHNREKKDLRTDINYNSYGIDIGAHKEIVKDFTLRTSFGFKNYLYRDFSSAFLNKRDDKVLSANIGLTYRINDDSSIEADINYINRTSNQFLYEYDRILTSLNYSYRF